MVAIKSWVCIYPSLSQCGETGQRTDSAWFQTSVERFVQSGVYPVPLFCFLSRQLLLKKIWLLLNLLVTVKTQIDSTPLGFITRIDARSRVLSQGRFDVFFYCYKPI